MNKVSVPSFLKSYCQDSFHLKQHLQEFLDIDAKTLEIKLETGQQQLTKLGAEDFDWEKATTFYRDQVGELYLFELGAWHLGSSDYIEDTLLLIVDHAHGRVLDFGGGIGTHTIATALCPQVEQVIYCDINPISRDFVRYRSERLGLGDKIMIAERIPPKETFDTIISFDVLEHLPDPSQQLLQFHQILQPEGKIILNWCFFKGFNQEHPFHLDDPQTVNAFFQTIQSNFLEVFHPYYITARCYRKWERSNGYWVLGNG
ncbi:bifunctional 2-polyprenyl-6-hydroxyphenol methylase/3-demethylubiquinol 3-O-methyltransferase UbiG [Nostoc sp. TCL26-01]|uniref:class I SAM-dependent methyltransferase n=1 Tax=Nostoc sp. TCL26-01 TaxID=2576904 RepID=UPI0015BFABA8|nr:class I SAM-dependent methyltransferase [Nostoc sp. TCL26-01]QLE58266.1 class I SAM-dependent methyltransferase [Nostoc sp. TCL26-01]